MGTKTPYALLSVLEHPTEIEEGDRNVEIRVRGVDSIAVNKIDEMAKKAGMSRQKFLKEQLELLAFWQEKQKREREYENILEKNISVMGACVEAMEKVYECITELTQENEDE